RQYASTEKVGTNMAGLQEAALRMGFEAKGVKGSGENLSNIPLPAIAHLLLPGDLYHYVVIYRVDQKRVLLMDPADGRMHRMPRDEFEKRWTGILLLLVPSANFKKGDQRTSTFKRFSALLRTHRSVMTEVLFGSFIYTLLGLA